MISGALFLVSSESGAQQETGGFYLITNPAGATACLDGEYDIITNTPARLPSNLSGNYEAKISLPGYENWKGQLVFAAGMSNDIEINLSRKTPLKASLRSLFIPGWGQYYSGNSMRGGLYMMGAAISAAGLYFADKNYQDKRADFDIAAQAYAEARSAEQAILLKPVKDTAQRVAYKAEDDRRTVFYIGVGIWTLNVLDAVLFFPDNKVILPSVSASDGGVMLNYQVEF